jgi:hypothetical protein
MIQIKHKKSLHIPKGQSETVNRRKTDNIKRKKDKQRATQTSPKMG